MPSFNIQAFLNEFIYDQKNPLLFNNGFFVFFFTLFIIIYYLFRDKIVTRKYIFCFFSLYFFYKASGSFVLLVIASAIIDFWISRAIFQIRNVTGKFILLLSSIAFNLGMLVFFKYTNFFIQLTNELTSSNFQLLNILLPVGISFYTFENLSYTIDIYRGHLKPARKFSDYLLFLSFFPKLVMGPIVRAQDFLPQINRKIIFSKSDFAYGYYLIISGLFKKLIISDFLTLNYVDIIFDDPTRYTGLENLFAVYGYALVIYFDFSGYSDMAIGIARWLGFHIPDNFLSPYQSENISEFWKRWHISLSSWLKNYLYIPMGGNKKGTFFTYIFGVVFFVFVFITSTQLLHLTYKMAIMLLVILLLFFLLPSLIKKDKKLIPTGFNLLATMVLGGFWHGASWNFIIWGSLHGIGLVVHKAFLVIMEKNNTIVRNYWLIHILKVVFTFHFVCFCWIFFKAENFSLAIDMIYQIIYDFNLAVIVLFVKKYKYVLGMVFFAYFLLSVSKKTHTKFILNFTRFPLICHIAIFFLFIFLYGFFKSSEPILPIYLKF